MIANCPQCAMALTFDDERLPTELFNVLCPRCRQTVTIMPPPKEEPRLPGSTGSLEPEPVAAAMVSPLAQAADPLRQLVDLLTAGVKQSQAPASPAKMWQRRRVLICLDDPPLRETVRAALDPAHYEIFSSDFAPE